MHYLVDGYSVIHSRPDLRKALVKRLAHARDLLVQQLQRFADQGEDAVTVFFDGRGGDAKPPAVARKKSGKPGPKSKGSKIEVVFSIKDQTADMLIERRVGQSRKPFEFLIVTADHAIENTVGALGASSISPDSFFERIAEVEKEFGNWLDDHRFRTKRNFERD